MSLLAEDSKSNAELFVSAIHEASEISTSAEQDLIAVTSTTPVQNSPDHTNKETECTGSFPSPWARTKQDRMSYLDHCLDLYERRKQQHDSAHVFPVLVGDRVDSDTVWFLKQIYGTPAPSPTVNIPSCTPSSTSTEKHRSEAERRLRQLLYLDPLPHNSHYTATMHRDSNSIPILVHKYKL